MFRIPNQSLACFFVLVHETFVAVEIETDIILVK